MLYISVFTINLKLFAACLQAQERLPLIDLTFYNLYEPMLQLWKNKINDSMQWSRIVK